MATTSFNFMRHFDFGCKDFGCKDFPHALYRGLEIRKKFVFFHALYRGLVTKFLSVNRQTGYNSRQKENPTCMNASGEGCKLSVVLSLYISRGETTYAVAGSHYHLPFPSRKPNYRRITGKSILRLKSTGEVQRRQ